MIAATEMALASRTGLFIDGLPEGPAHAILFGEDQARYLIAIPASEQDELDIRAAARNVPIR